MLSKEAGGGGTAPVVRFPQAGCWARMKEDIKSFHPEVKVSKSVKRLKRYSHFKIGQILHLISIIVFNPYAHSLYPPNMRSRLSMPTQPPVTNFPGNTAFSIFFSLCTCLTPNFYCSYQVYFRRSIPFLSPLEQYRDKSARIPCCCYTSHRVFPTPRLPAWTPRFARGPLQADTSNKVDYL